MPDTRSALLAAVAAEPDDDAPRLIYADWLDEQGEASRAEFIRLQCRAARLPRQDDARFTLERRADELLLEHEREWLGDWHERLVRWEFRRGYVHAATVTAEVFRKDGAALFAAEPVERLGFVDNKGDPLSAEAVPDVVSRPAFAHVRSLDILGATPVRPPLVCWHVYYDEPPVAAWLRALAAADHVVRLRTFGLGEAFGYGFLPPSHERNDSASAALEAFCAASHLRTLTTLDLRGLSLDGRATSTGVQALTAAPFAARLRRLEFSHWQLTNANVERLLRRGAFPELRFLDLTHNWVMPRGVEALFRNGPPRLEDVRINDVYLPALAASPMAGRLRGLDVVRNRGAAVQRQAEDAWLRLIETGQPPRRLTLNDHNPGPAALRAMRRHRWLRRVRTLKIVDDLQGEGRFHLQDIWNLLRGGGLRRLTRLRLDQLADRRLVAALLRWPGAPRLEELTLTDDLYDSRTPDLTAWPHGNGRLRRLHGLRLASDADADRLAACGNLGSVRQASLTIAGPIASAQLDRLFRGPALENLEALWLYWTASVRPIVGEVYRLLADPKVLPRLRTLAIVDSVVDAALDAVRQRFGPRLKV